MRNRILLWLLLFGVLALAAPRSDAAVTNTPVFVQTPKMSSTTFIQGTDTAGVYKTAYTGGTNGSKITGIYISSNDTAARTIVVQLSTSTSAHCSPQSNCMGGAAAAITGAANFTNASINILSPSIWPGLPIDSDGNPYIYLSGNTQTIEATVLVAITASSQLNVVVIGADF